jgi:hypothetical protein
MQTMPLRYGERQVARLPVQQPAPITRIGKEYLRSRRHDHLGAAKTPQLKAYVFDPSSTPWIGLPVGLKGRIANALAVGTPFAPKEA